MNKLIEIIKGPISFAKVKKFLYIFLVILVALDVLIGVMHLKHPTFAWDKIPGFLSLYSLISTVIIIVVSKAIGHAVLMKKEDFYD